MDKSIKDYKNRGCFFSNSLDTRLTKDEITKEQLWNLLLEIKKEAIEGVMHDEPFAMSHIYTLVHSVIEEEGN